MRKRSPRHFTVLQIEDNPADVLLMAKAFKKVAFEGDIQVSVDGDQALRRLHQLGEYRDCGLPDLILLDINMPKMNGMELLEQLKLDEALRHIPVLVLSSSSADSDVRAAYERFANAYLIKPSTLDGLQGLADAVCRFWLNAFVPAPG